MAKPAPKEAAAPKAAGTTLYDMLVKATGYQAEGNSHADYAAAVADGISKLDDNAYGKLPKKVTDWFDKAVDPINAGDTDAIPVIDGFPESTGKAVAPAKKAATKPADKKEKTAGTSGFRTDSTAFKMRNAVVINGPDVSFDDICKKAGVGAQERGGNAWNAYFNAIQVLRIATSHKLYKVKVVAE